MGVKRLDVRYQLFLDEVRPRTGQCFLNQYNGITFFRSRLWVSNDTIQLFTDSAEGMSRGGGGFGIFFL